jgi:hypothetical protein
LAALYSVFEADFKRRQLDFRGTRILYDGRILEAPYEEGFWHLITRTDQGSTERVFDPRRAECLPWFVPILSNCDDAAVKVWVWKDDKRRLRTYLWLEEFDYVIILQSRGGRVYFIVTACHVDGAGRRKQLQTRYDARER